MLSRPLGIRWTIGDVHPQGFEALQLSIWGARRIFGPQCAYAVCVNSLPLQQARLRTGEVPVTVQWHDVTGQLPDFLQPYLDRNMAEGVGWKLAPLRLFPDRYELALDNDCILWEMPRAIRAWLEEQGSPFVIAEDVRAMFGQFAEFCGTRPLNLGIRGLPPGFDLASALRQLLARRGPVVLASELDEQGLQVAVVSQDGPPLVVSHDEVTICSPFPPHEPRLGRSGAHFVGLNARQLPWDYYGRPAVDWIRENWLRHRDELHRMVGLPLVSQTPLSTSHIS